jgi:hypothetical protein
VSAADGAWTVEASRGRVDSAETDPAGPPPPVPDGFPAEQPPHEQVRPEIPEGEEGEAADPGGETSPGELMREDDGPEPDRSA